MDQLRFFRVLGTALTLAIMGACSSSDSDDSKSAPSVTITDAPSITIANVGSYSIGGTCTGGPGEQNSIEVVLGVNDLGNPACQNGEWALSGLNVSEISDGPNLKLTVTEGKEEATQTLIKDTQKPVVVLNTPAIVNSLNQNSYSAAGTCSDVGQDVVVDIEGLEKSVNCTASGWSLEGYNVSSLTVGSVSLSVNMKDAVGNPADEVSVIVVRDVLVPVVTITTTDLKIHNANKSNYALTGTCNEEGRSVMLKIAGRSDQTLSCSSSSWSFTGDISGVGDGLDIELRVEQEDAAGNKGVVKAALAKDTLAPVIGLDARQVVNSSNVAGFRLKGTCSEQGQNMIVTITGLDPLPTLAPPSPPCDGTSWEADLSSNAGEGSASVSLAQDDSFGNRGTATGTFVKDTTASAPTFDANLNITGANVRNYIIKGSCPEDGTVNLTIRSQAPVPVSCVGGKWAHASIDTTSWPDHASYTLSATLTDGAGNAGSSVNKSVPKDTTTLAVNINTPTPINANNKSSYPVSGGCSTSEGTLAVSVGGQSPAAAPSCSNGTWNTTIDVSSVSDNTSVAISVTLTSGTTATANATVLKDVVPPTLTITAPSAITLSNQSSYSVSGTCSGVDQSIEVGIGTLNFNTNCSSNSWTLTNKDVSALTASSITITADTTDLAGNPATQASANVVRDVLAPVLTMTTPDLNINAANVGTYTLQGNCEGTEDVIITIGALPAVTVSCSGNAWTLLAKDMSALNDGQNIAVVITQDDAVGNRGTLNKTLDKDIAPPTVTLSSSLLVSSSNVNSYLMTGSCSEDRTGAVVITIDTDTPTSVDCQGGAWQKSVSLTAKAEGNIEVSITHQDALGNGTTITRTLKKDTIAPTLTITAPVIMNSANQSNYAIGGACNENGAVITVTVQGQSSSLTFTCASSAWTVSGDFTSLIDNTQISVSASVQDAHGNTATKTASLAKDATLPEVTINTLAELTNNNKAAFPLAGNCSENTKEVVVNANAAITPSPQPTCQSGGWATNLNLSTLTENITISAHQVDSAGNTGNAPVKRILVERKTFLHSKIAVGVSYACALTSEGGVKCWGWQKGGRLGNNSVDDASILYPVDVVGRNTDGTSGGDGVLSDIAQISSGGNHTCALNSSGNVLCWGYGNVGQLGNNATTSSSFPVQVVGPDTNADQEGDGILSDIVQIILGREHSCALNSSGNVLCWGYNDDTQLGDDSTNTRSYPAFVLASKGSTTPLSGVVQLSVGKYHNCAVTSAGTVVCWGWGQGGLGSSSDASSNQGIPLGVLTESGGSSLSGIAQVACGERNTCALTLEGHVKCWGSSGKGALGDHGVVTESKSHFPVDVVGENGSGLLSGIVQISLGNRYACALNAQDKVWCWGGGGHGKLGNGSTGDKNYPVPVIAGSGSSSSLGGIIEIDASTDAPCALSEEDRVLCWGNGGYGKLGYGGTHAQYSPVTVIPSSGSTEFLNIGTYRGSYSCVGSGACALDPIGISLASGSSSPSSNASPSIEVSGIGTGKTLDLYGSADCSTTSGGAASPLATTIALSGLSEDSYRYYFDITDTSSNKSDCSKSFISYIYDNTAPGAPQLSFTTASGTDTTPDISVSGITPGDLVRVYSDSGCSGALAAPATRVDGVSRDITLNAISGATAHNFYATATDAAGNESACSTVATYTLSNP